MTKAKAMEWLFHSLAGSHYTHKPPHTPRLSFGNSVPTQGCVLDVVLSDFTCIKMYHYVIFPRADLNFTHSFIHTFTQLMYVDTHTVPQTMQSVGFVFKG